MFLNQKDQGIIPKLLTFWTSWFHFRKRIMMTMNAQGCYELLGLYKRICIRYLVPCLSKSRFSINICSYQRCFLFQMRQFLGCLSQGRGLSLSGSGLHLGTWWLRVTGPQVASILLSEDRSHKPLPSTLPIVASICGTPLTSSVARKKPSAF